MYVCLLLESIIACVQSAKHNQGIRKLLFSLVWSHTAMCISLLHTEGKTSLAEDPYDVQGSVSEKTTSALSAQSQLPQVLHYLAEPSGQSLLLPSLSSLSYWNNSLARGYRQAPGAQGQTEATKNLVHQHRHLPLYF